MKNHLLTICVLILLSINSILQSQQDSLVHPEAITVQLQSYIDSLMVSGMKEYRIPGAVITIVTDSSDLYIKGYGYADLETKKEVDIDKTIFRIASVTKTFTALAVMQLVDERKLGLHEDIRNYLPDEDFDFLSGEPFTLHHLLTHTAGFDLTDTGDAALSPEKIIPLEDLVRRHMPDQVHSPGKVHSYSNFGFALAGYIIQAVSGMSYEEYIQTKILNPLKMTHTGITQPLPPALQENMSKSYVWNEKQIPLERDYTNTLPGGGIISSGKDMGNYLLMLLNDGLFKDVVVVSSDTHKKMSSKQYGSKETKYGICYAFTENMWNGHRSIEHSGAQLGFLSLMILLPETGTGIFISQNNRKDTRGFRYEIAEKLLDTLIGVKNRDIEALIPPNDFGDVADNYIGLYRQMNYPHNTFEKVSQLFGIFSDEVTVEYDEQGRLIMFGDRFVQVSDHLFQIDRPTSNYKVEFIVDKEGRADQLFAGVYSYKKISWYQSKRSKQLVAIFGFAILFIQLLSKPIKLVIRKVRKSTISYQNTWISSWQYLTGNLFVIGTIGLVIIFLLYRDQVSDYGVPLSLKLVLLLNTLGLISALASPVVMWQVLKSKRINNRSKVFSAFVILSIVAFAIILVDVRMVGFQYY